MNLVSFALRRPISLLTMVIAVALVGFLALDRMARDIFPDQAPLADVRSPPPCRRPLQRTCRPAAGDCPRVIWHFLGAASVASR
jgi:hypothetical protein